jgi:peptide/nickel transport system substrate-binding protein
MMLSKAIRMIMLFAVLTSFAFGSVAWSQGATTEVGTPRAETLIVDSLDGRIDNPTQMNPFQAGTRFNTGYHQLGLSNLWEMNTITGEQFPALAEKMPEPLNDDFTKFRITLRKGMAWSDGVEITTDDLAYTIDLVLKTKEFPYSGYLSGVVKSYKVVDKYTLELETQNPDPRLSATLGVTVWGDAFRMIPKHVWEKVENPVTYNFYPPVTSGPYTLKSVDQNGNWYLWEKRADWAKTDVGMIVGEPTPKYILFRFYGPEEKRIIAGVQHNLDIFTDITPESWDILRQQNQYAKAWYNNFPWANLDDPCERGIALVTAKAPYDNLDVRWALALATNIDDVSLATFAGMLRVSPLPVPPVKVLQDTYHKPLRQWLTDFALADGYKPFDPSFATRMAKKLADQGHEGIPTDENQLVDLFGIGWWKFNPDKATELLTKAGFKKDASGWLLPDGKPWEIVINAPANFEVESGRLAFAVADTWRKFGIKASVQQMEAGTFWNSWATGDFSAGSYWPGCGVMPDVYDAMNGTWNAKYIVPVGQPAPGNNVRFKSDKLTALLDQIAGYTSTDPKTVEVTTEFMKAWVAEMPWLPMFGTSKFVPVDTYYWENFPTIDNPYEGPWWWWSLFKYMVPKFKPTGRTS